MASKESSSTRYQNSSNTLKSGTGPKGEFFSVTIDENENNAFDPVISEKRYRKDTDEVARRESAKGLGG